MMLLEEVLPSCSGKKTIVKIIISWFKQLRSKINVTYDLKLLLCVLIEYFMVFD